MNYPYSAENRLVKPHAYMYTPFEGAAFLKDYFEARHRDQEALEAPLRSMTDLTDLSAALLHLCTEPLRQLLADDQDDLRRLRSNLNWLMAQIKGGGVAFSYTAPAEDAEIIETEPLLLYLLPEVYQRKDIRMWVDRLVQRFEVTKKLYSGYLPGFRKPSGEANHLRLYGLFAVLMALCYEQNQNLKYFNALLKVNDLLGSVWNEMPFEQEVVISTYLALVFEEVFTLKLLAQKGLLDAVR